MTSLTYTRAPKLKNEVGDRSPYGVVQTVRRSSLSNVRARALSVEAVMDLAAEILWPEFGHEQSIESHGSTMVEVRNREET